MSTFQRKLSNKNNNEDTTPPPNWWWWGKEVWGVAFLFPENYLDEVKESKHFEVEGEGWSTGFWWLNPKKETLGGGMNQTPFGGNVLVLDIVDIVGIIIPKTIKNIPKN